MILDRIVARSGDVFPRDTDQERLRKQLARIVAGGRFTGWFILTYQAALVGLVLLFSVWHGYDKLSKATRARRARRAARRSKQASRASLEPEACHGKDPVDVEVADRSGASSSGSSTIEGNATPPESKKASSVLNEQAPLLSSTISRPLWPYSVLYRIRAALMYQPRPIPVVNKTLPENSSTLFILLLLALNIFYTVYRIEWEVDMMFVFSDRTAILFAANLPWLYFLGAKNQPLRLLTGYSYEHLNILHRRLGEYLCFLAMLHTGSMFMVWYSFFRPDGRSLQWFLMEKTVYLGLITLVCYELLYATSLASFRKWWYELFLGLHVFSQAGALGFLYFHHRGSQRYVLVTLVIFMVDRLVYRAVVKSSSFKADLSVMEDGNTILVSVNWPLRSRTRNLWTAIMGGDISHGWDPAEHVFLTVPALAPKHVVQAHPFTIASAAPEKDHEHAWLNLVIRALDGFTRDLLIYAQTHSSVTVRLDGPYGSMHALEMLSSTDVAVLMAGGSGIAVAYPMLWSLLKASCRDAEAAGTRQKVCLIWIVNHRSHISWIGQERLDELRSMGLHLVLPPPTSEGGRPDVAALLKNTIDELTNDEESAQSTSVMVSGPDGMNRAARNACSERAREGKDVSVMVEKFGW